MLSVKHILLISLVISTSSFALTCKFKSNTMLIVDCDIKQCTVKDKDTGRTDPEEEDLNAHIKEVSGMPSTCKELINIFKKIDLYSPIPKDAHKVHYKRNK